MINRKELDAVEKELIVLLDELEITMRPSKANDLKKQILKIFNNYRIKN